jgi:integrase
MTQEASIVTPVALAVAPVVAPERRPEMPTVRITAKFLKALKPGERRVEYRDSTFGEGSGQLVLRVEPSGKTTWSFVYYIPGTTRRRRVRIRERELEAVRRVAGELEDRVARGADPATEGAMSTTFGAAWESYGKQRGSHHAGWRGMHCIVERHLLPFKGSRGVPLAERNLADIGRRDVVEVLSAIMDDDKAATCAKAKSAMSSVWSWAMAAGYVETSPLFRLSLQSLYGRRYTQSVVPRERILTDEEIVTVWTRCREAISTRTSCALLLVLVTGQRPGEVLATDAHEVDLERGLWTIPPVKDEGRSKQRGKSGRGNVVPLSPQATALWREAIAIPVGKDGRIFRASRTVKFNDNRIAKVRKGMEHWTPHDLRRTAYSGMTALGFPRVPVVEAVVGHAIPGVAGVYDRYSYLAEKTAALLAWGQHLDDLIVGRQTLAPVVAIR